MKTSNENDSKKVVVLDKALKLAEGWVKQMNGGQDTAQDAEEVEIQIRPARLGLGAKFVPHSQFAATLKPVEKKLRAKLSAAKRQSDLDNEELCSIRKDNRSHKLENGDMDDDDYDSDSRANAFTKKKKTNLANSLQSLVTSGKKRKRKQKELK